jgi:hypothetical protein
LIQKPGIYPFQKKKVDNALPPDCIPKTDFLSPSRISTPLLQNLMLALTSQLPSSLFTKKKIHIIKHFSFETSTPWVVFGDEEASIYCLNFISFGNNSRVQDFSIGRNSFCAKYTNEQS